MGAFIGAVLVWLHYLPHFKTVPEPPAVSKDDLLLRRWVACWAGMKVWVCAVLKQAQLWGAATTRVGVGKQQQQQ